MATINTPSIFAALGIRYLATILCGLVLLSGGPLRSAPADKPETVEITLVGLGVLPSSLLFQDGSRVKGVALPRSGRGAPIRYSGASPLVMFTEKTDSEGNKTRVPMARITYSANWGKVLVVLLPGRSAEAPIQALSFDDSPGGFPADHARLFNFYPGDLAVSNQGDVRQVASGESALLPLTNRNGRTWMQMAMLRGGSWAPLPTFITQVSPGVRLLVFAYEQRNENGTMEPVYRTITQAAPVDTRTVAMR